MNVVREQSARQSERLKSSVEPGKYSGSTSMILQSDEVAMIAPPTPAATEPIAPGFEGLEPLEVRPDDLLPAGVPGALHGVLENGIRYYVRKNAKPRDRAALALAVSVG